MKHHWFVKPLATAAILLLTALLSGCPGSITLTVTATPNKAGAEGSVSSNPAGIQASIPSPLTSSANFPAGSTVTLTATPGSNSLFDSWSANCPVTSPNSCALVMNGPMAVNATFTLKPLLGVTIISTNGGFGTVKSTTPAGIIDCGTDCEEFINPNTQVTLEATPDTNSTFKSWTGCDTVNGNTCTKTVTTDAVVTAEFVKPTPPALSSLNLNDLPAGTIAPGSYPMSILDAEGAATGFTATIDIVDENAIINEGGQLFFIPSGGFDVVLVQGIPGQADPLKGRVNSVVATVDPTVCGVNASYALRAFAGDGSDLGVAIKDTSLGENQAAVTALGIAMFRLESLSGALCPSKIELDIQ